MVSARQESKFWTVASVVVRNEKFDLPQSESGDGLVIIGYGWLDFYLAWIPLDRSGPQLQKTLYYTKGSEKRWNANVAYASGLFGTSNLADPNHISMAWLEGPKLWALLYCRAETESKKGFVIARFGASLWDWSEELPLISELLTPQFYSDSFVSSGSWPYGPYILDRFTKCNDITRTVEIYYLISFSKGYQVHLMRSQFHY